MLSSSGWRGLRGRVRKSSRYLVCALAFWRAAGFCRFGNIARAAVRSLLLLRHPKKSGGAPAFVRQLPDYGVAGRRTPKSVTDLLTAPAVRAE